VRYPLAFLEFVLGHPRPFISVEIDGVFVGASWPCGCFAFGESYRQLLLNSGACDKHASPQSERQPGRSERGARYRDAADDSEHAAIRNALRASEQRRRARSGADKLLNALRATEQRRQARSAADELLRPPEG
jgi:hypothetical protein